LTYLTILIPFFLFSWRYIDLTSDGEIGFGSVKKPIVVWRGQEALGNLFALVKGHDEEQPFVCAPFKLSSRLSNKPHRPLFALYLIEHFILVCDQVFW